MSFSQFIARKLANSREKTRSYKIITISIATISLCVAVMILATCLINGFQRTISDKIFGFWGHIHVTYGQVSSMFESEPFQNNQEWQKKIIQVRSSLSNDHTQSSGPDAGIRHIQSYTIKPSILQYKEVLQGILCKGVGPDFDWGFIERYLIQGKSLKGINDSIQRNILISEPIANKMGLQIGDKCSLHFVMENASLERRCIIAGIYRTGLDEYDQKFVFVDIKLLQQLNGWDEHQIGGLEIQCNDWRDLNNYTQVIYNNYLPAEYYCESIREKFPAIFDWLQLQNTNKYVLIALLLFISIVNISTSLLILILENSQKAGIWKALGASNWQVRKVFIYHALYITIRAVIIGNIIGLGLASLQHRFRWITLSEAEYYISYAPVEFRWSEIFMLNGFTILIIWLCLILPSVVVTHISPIRSIHFSR